MIILLVFLSVTYIFFFILIFSLLSSFFFFFFNDTATTEIYTLSLHDALPISMLADPGIVAGRQPFGAGAAGEREQLGEAEPTVAPRAWIRGLAARVAAHERLDDRAAELLAQVERHVRYAETVAGLPSGDHGLRRAARAFGMRAFRVGPESQRHSDRVRAGAQQSDRRVDAAAHRHRHAAWRAR